jgi:hypothetical protein
MKMLGGRALENEIIINPTESKAVCFTKVRVTELLNHSWRDILIQEASSCEYLRISWADQANYMVKEILEGTSFQNAYS